MKLHNTKYHNAHYIAHWIAHFMVYLIDIVQLLCRHCQSRLINLANISHFNHPASAIHCYTIHLANKGKLTQ